MQRTEMRSSEQIRLDDFKIFISRVSSSFLLPCVKNKNTSTGADSQQDSGQE